MGTLPTSTEDCKALVELIEDNDLMLGSDGPADYSNLAMFLVTLTSTDLTVVHTLSHAARGKPYDSGRSELFCVLTLAL